MKQFIDGKTICNIKRRTKIGSLECKKQCEYIHTISEHYIYCKPPLRIMFATFLNNDKFKEKLLYFIFGFCFGGIFMALVGGVFK